MSVFLGCFGATGIWLQVITLKTKSVSWIVSGETFSPVSIDNLFALVSFADCIVSGLKIYSKLFSKVSVGKSTIKSYL
jgi:hypothetical protein